MKKKFHTNIACELAKLGWTIRDPFGTVFVAHREVDTFVGIQYATIDRILVDEDGTHYLKASFDSRGENVLAHCNAYINTVEETPTSVAAFHSNVMNAISNAFSVRMLKYVEGNSDAN